MNIATNRHERRKAGALNRRGASDDDIREQIIADRKLSTPAGISTDRCGGLDAIGARHLSVREAAAYLGLSVAYLNRLRSTGGGPPFFKISTRVVYGTAADLDDWLAQHRRTSTSDTYRR